jgi:hypothetical protein
MIAAGVGTVHALVTIYWAFGGSALLQTVGRDMVVLFAGRRWLLLPVAAVKLAVAVAPVVLDRRSWPWRPLTRGLAWSAATVLIFWGGINTVVGNLVLGGAIEPSGGYDRRGMIGHAWLWDPLFLLWGTALAVGLAGSRRPKPLRELADRATPLDPTIWDIRLSTDRGAMVGCAFPRWQRPGDRGSPQRGMRSGAASLAASRPAATDPVNAITGTSGWVTKAALAERGFADVTSYNNAKAGLIYGRSPRWSLSGRRTTRKHV